MSLLIQLPEMIPPVPMQVALGIQIPTLLSAEVWHSFLMMNGVKIELTTLKRRCL